MKLYLPHTWKFGMLAAGLLLAGLSLRADDSGSVTNPLVVVVAPDPTALVGTSSGAFTLIRNGATDADLNVNVMLSGTASNGVDYVTISNIITIPAGSLAADVKVDPIANNANPGNKTVILSIQTSADYNIREHHQAVVKILDDVFDFALPTVTITSPTNNSSFTNPPSITLSADANDPDAAIGSVSFYANDDFLGRATNVPYTLVWSNPPSGRFALFARAIDQFGRSALSSPVHIAVIQVRPAVQITSPTNGANLVAHQDIPISADASDPDGIDTIASVSFYANNHLLGTATSEPFSIVWSNAPGGVFRLKAVATDSSGEKGFSKPVMIKVKPVTGKRVSK